MQIKMPPFTATWEITSKCNAKCVYCGSQSASESNELTTTEALNLVSQFKELDLKIVNLIGGEPFLRSDLEQIIIKLRKYDIEVGIVSNGTLLDESKVNWLKNLDLMNISLSLDGNEAVHNKLRKGAAFPKVVESLKLLVENKIPTSIITTVQKQNFSFESLESLLELKRRLKLNSWRIQVAMPIGRMGSENVLSQEEYYGLSKWIADKNRKNLNEIFVGDNIGFHGSNNNYLRRGPWAGCGAGVFSVGITPEGNVKGCVAMSNEFIEGSVRERRLKDIWYDNNAFSYNRNFSASKLAGKCRACEFNEECKGGCRSFSKYKAGKFESFLCNYYFEKEHVK